MRKMITIICLLACVCAGAAEQHLDATNNWSDGLVKKVDPKNGNVTLQHADIANVMPAMTMSYRVVHPEWLNSIHVGDKVRFTLEKQHDNYFVTRIRLNR